MFRRRLTFVASLTAAAALMTGCATAGQSTPAASVQPAFSAERISGDIRTISDDTFQGRYPVSYTHLTLPTKRIV